MGASASISIKRYVNCYSYKHITNNINDELYNSIVNIDAETKTSTLHEESTQSNHHINNDSNINIEYFDDTFYIKSFLNDIEATNLFNELAIIGEAHRSERPATINPKYPLWALYFGLKRNKDNSRALDRWGSYHESWCRVLEPSDTLKKVADKIRAAFNLNPNSCNSMVVNYYFDGDTTYIPAHRDTVYCLEDNSSIFCLSLGAERSFVLSSNDDIGKYKMEELQVAKDWRVKHGDLVALGQITNENYLHSIPKENSVSTMRISIIFRSIDKSFINLETAESKAAIYANGRNKIFAAELISTKGYDDEGQKEHLVDLINERERIKVEKKLKKQLYAEDSKDYYFGEGLTVPKNR